MKKASNGISPSPISVYRRLFLLLNYMVIIPGVFAQSYRGAELKTIRQLQTHVQFLAGDLLEGRRAGSAGERQAADYLVAQFRSIGLKPAGKNGSWLQGFEIFDGKKIAPGTQLILNNTSLLLTDEFFPLSFSAEKNVAGEVTIALTETGVPWFWDVKDLLESNKDNPHFELYESIRKKAEQASEKGATALLLYNSGSIPDHLELISRDKTALAPIPVVYLTPAAQKKFLSDQGLTVRVEIRTAWQTLTRTAYNVIGFLNNKAPTTVVIGAHYDHLGYGEDGNSMLRTGEKLIHNGADDNASGTAGLIELARLLKKAHLRNNNFLFIAFSGEELGLNGSKHFVDSPTRPPGEFTYMINMDMIGRLNDSAKAITVGGTGTSPWWSQVLKTVNTPETFSLKLDSSGTGPSDHTSFYRKNIPVLFFFTGLHADYHRPSDDFQKINYPGIWSILQFIEKVITATAPQQKLVFTKTREAATSTTARFNVTLGIMPDYTFSGNGVHVEGISEGRPAQKAGLKPGDIILKLGEYPTVSVEAYMQVLGKFKKGDKTKVQYKRGNQVNEMEVQF